MSEDIEIPGETAEDLHELRKDFDRERRRRYYDYMKRHSRCLDKRLFGAWVERKRGFRKYWASARPEMQRQTTHALLEILPTSLEELILCLALRADLDIARVLCIGIMQEKKEKLPSLCRIVLEGGNTLDDAMRTALARI